MGIIEICKRLKYESPWLYRNIVLVLGLTMVLTGIFFVSGRLQSFGKNGAKVSRNEYGDGNKTEVRKVKTQDGKEKNIEIQVSERAFTEKEVKEMLDQAMKEMDFLILGENESLDHVTQNMNLVTTVKDTPIQVAWVLDSYEYMNMYGELQPKEIGPEGTLIALSATLVCQGQQAVYKTNANVFPPEITGRSKTIQMVETAARKQEEKTASKSTFYLPSEVAGEKVRWRLPTDYRWVQILALGVIFSVLLVLLEKEKKLQKEKSIIKEMSLDYPELVSKMTLLIGAGLTVKGSWEKICADYEKQKYVTGKKEVYEQIQQSLKENESGIAEQNMYLRFGKRCKTKEYIRLGALLSQNLRKGSKGLCSLLEMEAHQAFEERKAYAKRLGEEAGTKMLFPMFIMLAVVLVIVIVPAFLTMGS